MTVWSGAIRTIQAAATPRCKHRGQRLGQSFGSAAARGNSGAVSPTDIISLVAWVNRCLLHLQAAISLWLGRTCLGGRPDAISPNEDPAPIPASQRPTKETTRRWIRQRWDHLFSPDPCTADAQPRMSNVYVCVVLGVCVHQCACVYGACACSRGVWEGRGGLPIPRPPMTRPAMSCGMVAACPEPGGSACCYWNGCGSWCTHPAQGLPAAEPGGSACCYWNGYGSWCTHPAQTEGLKGGAQREGLKGRGSKGRTQPQTAWLTSSKLIPRCQTRARPCVSATRRTSTAPQAHTPAPSQRPSDERHRQRCVGGFLACTTGCGSGCGSVSLLGGVDRAGAGRGGGRTGDLAHLRPDER